MCQPTDLWLVRHGHTAEQQAGRFQTREVGLSGLGLEQAGRLASRLGLLNGFAALYSSPLPRAMGTAALIARSLNLEGIVISDLREIEFGLAGGLTMDEFRRRWPALVPMLEDPLDTDFQWPGGESRKEFHRRSLAAIQARLMAHAGERILLVAHTGNLCGYLAHCFLGDAARWREFPVQPASISRVEIGFNEIRLLLLDDISHLSNLGAYTPS